MKCSIIIQSFIGYEETSSYWSAQFFSAFHWSPSIAKPRMTPVSFVKSTESSVKAARNHTRDADESYLPQQCRMRSVHSCNSWFYCNIEGCYWTT